MSDRYTHTAVADPADDGGTDYWLTLADTLVEIAESLTKLAGKVPPATGVSFTIQPGPWNGGDAEKIRNVDTIARALLGHDGKARPVGKGVHHDASGTVGAVEVGVFRALAGKGGGAS